MDALVGNYRRVAAEVAAAAAAAGRDPAELTLLPVSKTFPAEDIRVLYDRCGCRAFGENRVDELLAKAAELPPDIEWHLIGRLQANKVRKALTAASVLHAVDSDALLRRIDRIAGELGKKPRVLIEVNVSGEESKAGVAPGEAAALTRLALTLPNLTTAGFMTMAPFEAGEAELAAIFGQLRTLKEKLECTFNTAFPLLSMGMSGDFRVAVQAGSTLLRIGSSIFGDRHHG